MAGSTCQGKTKTTLITEDSIIAVVCLNCCIMDEEWLIHKVEIRSLYTMSAHLTSNSLLRIWMSLSLKKQLNYTVYNMFSVGSTQVPLFTFYTSSLILPS